MRRFMWVSRSLGGRGQRNLAGQAEDGQRPRFLEAEYNTSREVFLLLWQAG